MVLAISNYFGFGHKSPQHKPMITQLPLSLSDNASSYGITSSIIQKNKFWKWFKTRPELNSPIAIRVDDTICEVEFFAPDGTPLGRNKRLSSEKFWNDNFMYEILKSFQFDRLTTGSGYLWLGKLSKEQLREVVKGLGDKFYFERNIVNMREVGKSLFKRAIDEDLATPRKVDYVASSSMSINHDNYEVKGYTQWYGANKEDFSPEDIIHLPLHRIDGKVEGFTPLESLGYELLLLWAIKENMLSYIRNGGSPNKLYILPEEIANSTNHKWLIQELSNKGILENRHGHIVLTGKVEVQQLEPDIKDMEYKDLALYVTSNIAYGFRVPVSRIPYLIGSAQSKGDAGGMAESGYWSMIESDQRTIEQAINTQLCNKLGFMFKFKRKYKIDDLREAQAMNFRMDAVTKMRNELTANKLKIRSDKLVSLLSGCDNSISMNDVEEIPEEEQNNGFQQQTGLLGKTFMKDKEVIPDAKNQNEDAVKEEAGKNNPKNSNQTGY